MLQKKSQEMTIHQTFHEPQFFIAAGDGQVFKNVQKLPLETLLAHEQFKGQKDLLRFAYDPGSNSVFVQDAKGWHDRIGSGEDEAWNVLNVALRFLRQNFGVQPRLRYGEAPGTYQIRKLSQFEQAWADISEYVSGEFGSEPKDIPVIEYVPRDSSAALVEFSDTGGTAGKVDVTGPAFFINLSLNDFGELDYDKVNEALAKAYLRNFPMIHTAEWTPHVKGDDNLFFAIWSGGTRIFRASQEQRARLLGEQAVRMEPSLRGYKGPVLLFSFDPKDKALTLHNAYQNSIGKSNFLKQILGDILRKVGKSYGIAESSIVIKQDDMQFKPQVSKMSKHGFVWDLIRDMIAPKAGAQIMDVRVVKAPLTKEHGKHSFLVRSMEDEKQIPAAVALKAKHRIDANYPYIAVDSRVRGGGREMRELLKQYVKLFPALQHVPLIQYNFIDEGQPFSDFVSRGDFSSVKEAMEYMLEYGFGKKAVLDFFARREDLDRRSFYMKLLGEVFDEHKQAKAERRAEMLKATKTASLELGINDWYFYGLQEDLNQAQHMNNTQGEPASEIPGLPPGGRSYNHKKTREQQRPSSTTEGLLNKKHDRELNYMKSTEQLLRESQI